MQKYIIVCICLLPLAGFGFCADIKIADLAGSWYPANPLKLREQIDSYLNKAKTPALNGEIIALVCPHAGITYSGQTAAYCFKALEGKKIDTVILVGFTHRRDYEGVAVFDRQGFKTPLGVLYTDKPLAEKIIIHDGIFADTAPFKGENSVELILPFIQVAYPKAKVLLLVMGRQTFDTCSKLGQALYEVLKDKHNAVIISSTDMSHFLSLDEAQKIDSATADLITQMEPRNLFYSCYGRNRMCGTGTVVAAMIAAKKLGAGEAVILNQSTSAASTLDTRRVVGYLSAAFINRKETNPKESEDMESLINAEQKKELLKLARDTITLYLKEKKTLKPQISDPRLEEIMGVFVTLHKGDQLRGCIGNIIGRVPLYVGVRDMAISSSTQDPRFPPVSEKELEDINIEISVLSPLKKIEDPDEIILGTHGVLVKSGWQQGVFLPQVATETGWSKEEFMNALCGRKAGMAADAWKKGKCEIYIFSAEVFGE